MTFEVAAEAYDGFVGRYGCALGAALVSAAGLKAGARALDVGAGTGKLTGALAELLGEENVVAVEPSVPFAATLRERFPRAEVVSAGAEDLPFPDHSFDAAFAQLVVNFLADPEQGVAEMRRVVRAGGVVAACVWDYRGEMTLLRTFWEAAAAVDERGVEARDERTRARFGELDELVELWRAGGLRDTKGGEFRVSADYESFDDLWAPFLQGVGPAGAYTAALDAEAQEALRDELRDRLGAPTGPFTLEARAWYAVGTA
jgi:SAM-dependent methyltransferase